MTVQGATYEGVAVLCFSRRRRRLSFSTLPFDVTSETSPSGDDPKSTFARIDPVDLKALLVCELRRLRL